MKNIRKINENYRYLGVNDREISLFENVYPMIDGMSYNSYLLKDEKTVLFDTVEKSFRAEFMQNLKDALDGCNLDYFIINHLEPDHAALIKDVVDKYPNVKIVTNQKAKDMIYQFFEFDFDIEANFNIVKEGDTLNTGKHNLTFVLAPMVHWPEVMVTYDTTDKILFSADAFGSFGALSGNLFDDEVEFEELIGEYRRYYTNIVGKYGAQVTALLNKAKNLDIKTVCPLHGLILRKNISLIADKYQKWASYTPEINSVLVVYSSVWGNTKNACEIIASKLAAYGIKNIKMIDISHLHSSFALASAFKYSHILIATTTYNNDIFVNMKHFISDIVSHNLQNRTFAIIENGSWVSVCAQKVKELLSTLKNSKFIEKTITIKSALKENQEIEFDELVKLIKDDLNK